MTNQSLSEKAIRKAKREKRLFQTLMKIGTFVKGSKKNSSYKEIFVNSAVGKTKVLCYGFDNKEVEPVFIDLHGGGFIMGAADMDDGMNLSFHQQVGCKVMSIEYAKAPDYPYPAAVNQIYEVIRYVVENAEKFGIDPERMAIGGHSAGGNLSTVMCMKAAEEGQFQFVCQILDYPPLDLGTSPFDKPQPKGCIPPERAAMYDACYVDPAQTKDPYVSPVYASQEQLSSLPPAMIIVAGQDSLHDEAIKYSELLDRAGVDVEIHEYPDALHGFTLHSSVEATDAIKKMTLFLQKHLAI